MIDPIFRKDVSRLTRAERARFYGEYYPELLILAERMEASIQKAREYVSSLTKGEIGGGDEPVETLISIHRAQKGEIV